MRPALLSALLSVAACQLDVEPSGTFRCDDNHACPAGYDCEDGFCARPEPDAGPGPDGGAQADCGKMSLLSDDFESEGTPSFWWSLNEADGVSQVGGELILSPLSNKAESYPQYYSNPSYDLIGSSVMVEVPQSVNQADGVYASLTAQVGGGEMVAISQENGKLWVLRVEGGLFDAIEGADYSADDHRFWRLRDDGEHMFAEASPDGDGDWVELASVDSDPLFRYAHVMLEAGSYEAVADPGGAHFDHLNPDGPSGDYCKLDTFTDEFDDGETSPAWLTGSYVVGGAAFEENAGLSIELGDTAESEGMYISAPRFDLRDSALALEVSEVTAAGTVTWLGLRAHQADRLEVHVVVVNGMLELRVVTDDDTDTELSTPYDPEAHAWWRLLDDDDELVFQVSSDGDSWNELDRFDDPFGETPVLVHLGARNFEGVAEPGRARFRHLNAAPR